MSQNHNDQLTQTEHEEGKQPYDTPEIETIDDARAMITLATGGACGQAQTNGAPVDNCTLVS
ncbi:MAG TPA: hypothetical protein DCQ06_04495 [Myxococcales bacterium]|nr:hypothetical protein [Myxococcales bacterium]|tara:strand:+ start:261 stop:446 length:186 start_codon:yes stop_codon:yes gene_type:complete